MAQQYKASNVLPEDRPQEEPLEGDKTCLSDVCPTEEDWCARDPKCSVSPYQEPPGTIKAEILAAFISILFAAIIYGLYLLHLKALEDQEERNRKTFARGMMRSIYRPSMRGTIKLTADTLTRKFDRIRGEDDSLIEKQELWDYLQEDGETMSKDDFEVLFSTMDVDGSGQIDFMEFCAFMQECRTEIQEEKLNVKAKLRGNEATPLLKK